jgi:hypothetical protein
MRHLVNINRIHYPVLKTLKGHLMHFAFLVWWSESRSSQMSMWNHAECMPTIVSKFSTRWAFISLRESQLLFWVSQSTMTWSFPVFSYDCWLWQVRGCFLQLPQFSPCKEQKVHQYSYNLGNIDIIMANETTSWRTFQPPYLSIRWPQREANIV